MNPDRQTDEPSVHHFAEEECLKLMYGVVFCQSTVGKELFYVEAFKACRFVSHPSTSMESVPGQTRVFRPCLNRVHQFILIRLFVKASASCLLLITTWQVSHRTLAMLSGRMLMFWATRVSVIEVLAPDNVFCRPNPNKCLSHTLCVTVQHYDFCQE